MTPYNYMAVARGRDSIIKISSMNTITFLVTGTSYLNDSGSFEDLGTALLQSFSLL